MAPKKEDVNDFDDDQLERAFNACVKFIQTMPKDGPIKTPIEDQLRAYALFKQATIGPCNTEKPPIYHPIDRFKWNVWNSLGNMSRRDAMREYIVNFIKRTECNYEKHYKDIPGWITDKKYAELRQFVRDHKDDFGITCMNTLQGVLELTVIGKNLGFEV